MAEEEEVEEEEEEEEEEKEEERNPDDAAAEKNGTEVNPFEWPWICHSPILVSAALSCIRNFNSQAKVRTPNMIYLLNYMRS